MELWIMRLMVFEDVVQVFDLVNEVVSYYRKLMDKIDMIVCLCNI